MFLLKLLFFWLTLPLFSTVDYTYELGPHALLEANSCTGGRAGQKSWYTSVLEMLSKAANTQG